MPRGGTARRGGDASTPTDHHHHRRTAASTPDMTIVKQELTPSPHLLDHGYGATPINQVMSATAAAAGASAPPVKRKLNMETHSYVVPIKHEFKAPPPKRQKKAGAAPAKKLTRYDTSLSLLTKRFSDLIKLAPNGVVDLNKASQELQVQKRRIYDITNVLEGIGILEKKGKNNIQWKADRQTGNFVQLAKQMQMLEDRENQLDSLLASTENELRTLDHRYGYVTYHDLKSIERFRHKTVMAVKAPPNTHLSVPKELDEDLKYTIKISSKEGEIEVFLCPENVPQPAKVAAAKAVPPMDPLLRDIHLSPGMFDLRTPPVPRLDSPAGQAMQHRPMSSQICRSISFKEDSNYSPFPSHLHSAAVQSGSSYASSGIKQEPSRTTSSSSTDSAPLDADLRLSPLEFGRAGASAGGSRAAEVKPEMSLLHGDALGPMVGRYPMHMDHHHHHHHQASQGVDPLLCTEPFVALEPLIQSEYNFSLDTSEGIADLFDYDLFHC